MAASGGSAALVSATAASAASGTFRFLCRSPWGRALRRSAPGSVVSPTCPVCPVQACLVAVYADPNLTGLSVETAENQPRLDQSQWQNQISSIMVKSGTWDFYPELEFAGSPCASPQVLPGAGAAMDETDRFVHVRAIGRRFRIAVTSRGARRTGRATSASEHLERTMSANVDSGRVSAWLRSGTAPDRRRQASAPKRNRPDRSTIISPIKSLHGDPGLALAIVKSSAIVHAAGYGLANIKDGAPIVQDTIFHLASCGKQFTGLGILMLAEERKLHPDDPLESIFRRWPALVRA